MRPVEHRSHGLPLESYELTCADRRTQKQAEDIEEHVRKIVDAAPPLTTHQISILRPLLRGENRTQDHELMRWRLRLFCGHIVEARRRLDHEAPASGASSSMTCPECGLAPALIVGYQPLGLVAESPEPEPPPADRRA